MDPVLKQKALEEAFELTKAALSSTTGNVCAVAHPDNATKFLDETYRKLCELWEDSMSAD